MGLDGGAVCPRDAKQGVGVGMGRGQRHGTPDTEETDANATPISGIQVMIGLDRGHLQIIWVFDNRRNPASQ